MTHTDPFMVGFMQVFVDYRDMQPPMDPIDQVICEQQVSEKRSEKKVKDRDKGRERKKKRIVAPTTEKRKRGLGKTHTHSGTDAKR